MVGVILVLIALFTVLLLVWFAYRSPGPDQTQRGEPRPGEPW
jgi:hypothetical protein